MQLYPGELMSTKQVFIPANHEYLNDRDLNLSTAPPLIPDLPLAIACSKKGKCYVGDRSDMRLVQEFQAGGIPMAESDRRISMARPWRGGTTRECYACTCGAEEDYLRTFQFNGMRFVGAGKSKMRAGEEHARRDSVAIVEWSD